MLGENIENLKDELTTIKEELDDLKQDTDKSISTRKKEANELLQQARETEKKLREEINKINDAIKEDKKSVDRKIKKAKEDAESFLEDDIMEEIEELHGSIKKSKKKKKKEKDEEGGSRWSKFFLKAGIAATTVIGGVEVFKNWNRISSWVKEKLGKALNFEDAMSYVEAEVRNGVNTDDNFGNFSAHFTGITYNEKTQEITSFGQKTKLNKSKKGIDGLDGVQFASWEELFHAVNIINFAKRQLRGRGANGTPFTVNGRTGDIDFSMSNDVEKFISANGSNFWTMVLGIGGAGGGGLLGGYFLGLKGGLTGAVAGGLTGYTLGSVIDNTSTMGRVCGTIAKGTNLQNFVNYLNKQTDESGKSLRESAKDQRLDPAAPDATPITSLVDNGKEGDEEGGILREIISEYGNGDDLNGIRNFQVEWDKNKPEEYTICSFNQKINMKIEGGPTKKGEKIDYKKIKKIHIEKYDTIDEQKIDCRGDGLDINFPCTEEGLKEAIKTANLTNFIVNQRKKEGGEKYPFAYGKYISPKSSISDIFDFNLDIDTPGKGANRQGGTCIIKNATLKKIFPTIYKDLESSRALFTKGIPSQKEWHDQAYHDKSEGSQYIKFLHQIGQGKFRKK